MCHFISEYKITMYDTKKDEMRWNATYKDYSAHVNEKVSHDYGEFLNTVL